VVKPIIFLEMIRKCQVNLIDMQSQGDGEFWFIVLYKDHLTKFVQLRTRRTEKVENHFINIFCIFGAPIILKSDNGQEIVNKIIED